MPDKRKYSITKRWQEDDKAYYKVAADSIEFTSPVRISKTQKATHGEAALLSWCRHHAAQLGEKRIVDVDLNEEVVK